MSHIAGGWMTEVDEQSFVAWLGSKDFLWLAGEATHFVDALSMDDWQVAQRSERAHVELIKRKHYEERAGSQIKLYEEPLITWILPQFNDGVLSMTRFSGSPHPKLKTVKAALRKWFREQSCTPPAVYTHAFLLPDASALFLGGGVLRPIGDEHLTVQSHPPAGYEPDPGALPASKASTSSIAKPGANASKEQLLDFLQDNERAQGFDDDDQFWRLVDGTDWDNPATVDGLDADTLIRAWWDTIDAIGELQQVLETYVEAADDVDDLSTDDDSVREPLAGVVVMGRAEFESCADDGARIVRHLQSPDGLPHPLHYLISAALDRKPVSELAELVAKSPD